ncbi:unnamed protein product [Zymoseptoria tritici ST99CH_3D1]|nr:unnamed protein product [Zymoseptoria tritici ST99CH_3D1]
MLRQCSYYINRAKHQPIDPDNSSSFQEVRNADFPLAKLTKLVTISAKGHLKTNEALVKALGKNDPDATFVYDVLKWCCLEERTFGAFIMKRQIRLCKEDDDGMCTLSSPSEASEKYFNDFKDNEKFL